MKTGLKKIIFLGFALFSSCLAAQENNLNEDKEISMSSSRDMVPTREECQGERVLIRRGECQPREDKRDEYEYDVYTKGGNQEDESNHCSISKRSSHEGSNCDSSCKRKGAAKAAQE